MMLNLDHTVRRFGRSVLRLAVLASVFAWTANGAAAQQSAEPGTASAQIGVQVEIGQALALLGTNDLSFGQVAATNSITRKRVERGSPDAGRFELRGAGNNAIRVTYTAPTQLTNENGAGVIGVALELYGAPTLANASSAERLLQNETVSLSAGRYYFFVAGELSVGPISTNPPGMYLGEFELEVSYLDL